MTDELGLATPQPRASMLDAPPLRSGEASVLAGVGTMGLHVALVVLASLVGGRVVQQVRSPESVTQMIEVELPQDPPMAPVPHERPVRALTPSRSRERDAAREAPPPAAAQAAQVLTAADEVVDFGDTFVAGQGASYAGGVTEAQGTSKQAVSDVRARAGGVEGGTGNALGGDLSRAPALAGGARWDCPFPEEADLAGIDRAVVTLRVEVAADGRVLSASVTRDPGDGFGREARRCALKKRWAPGRDRAGQAANAEALVNVRFAR